MQAVLDSRQPRSLLGLLLGRVGEEGLFDFLLFALPDNDNYSHRHGPQASVESIAKADRCFGSVLEAAGGLDAFLQEYALIVLADHAQTPVHRGLPLAELLGREWRVLQPSEERPERAQLAVSPTGRAAHVYLLPSEELGAAEPRAVAAALTEIEGVDLVCRLEEPDGQPLRRPEPGVPAEEAAVAVIERAGEALRFHPGVSTTDLRGRGWELAGDRALLGARIEQGRLRSEVYPDPLARVWSALMAPNAGDFVLSLSPGFEALDWGGVTHVGGGSHGSLHAGDSLGPLLFVGCGPERAEPRQQWALRDVAPLILDFFGVSEGA